MSDFNVTVASARRSPRWTGAGQWLFRPAPTPGEHTREVLTMMCGLTDAELDRLAAQGVIGTRKDCDRVCQ